MLLFLSNPLDYSETSKNFTLHRHEMSKNRFDDVNRYITALVTETSSFKFKITSPSLSTWIQLIPAVIYLLKVNNRNGRTRCEICSKLTIKTRERRLSYTEQFIDLLCKSVDWFLYKWCCPGVFIVYFEHISHPVLVFLLLTLNMSVWHDSKKVMKTFSNMCIKFISTL